MVISFGIGITKGVCYPVTKSRPLIIDKEAAIFYRRLLGKAIFLFYAQVILFHNCGIAKVMKGADSYQFRQMEKPIDGATLIATKNKKHIPDKLKTVYFCISLQIPNG